MQAIDDFIQALSKLDCGSSSCEFAQNKFGQRSNSGCQCLGGYRDNIKIPVYQIFRTLGKTKIFTDPPISGYEALYDVKVPLIDLPDEAVKKSIEKFKNSMPKSFSEQKPLDADIAEHINNHFEELL